jgi:hypothetical protein
MDDTIISKSERKHLRELAKKYMEYANLPIMNERVNLWYAHNDCNAERPVIIFETSPYEHEFLPTLKCTSKNAKKIELQLLSAITCFEKIDDDKVISPYFSVDWQIELLRYGIEKKRIFAQDDLGINIGFQDEHLIGNITKDLPSLGPSIYYVNRKFTAEKVNMIADLMGDILPVVVTNTSLRWEVSIAIRAVELMGLEAMMISMIDCPLEIKKLFRYIVNDIQSYISWQESEQLLTLNNGNDFVGSGSYGFTNELPSDQYLKTGNITTKDLWVNLNSQESVGISPMMYGEFIFPLIMEIAKRFGLVYYGCCEPVDSIWDEYISKLPNLRKVSISPWCNEKFMGDALKGSRIIYSRKPHPSFLGVDKNLNEEAFADHIQTTLKCANGCTLEFIFRDIYTLTGNINKLNQVVNIIKRQIDKSW